MAINGYAGYGFKLRGSKDRRTMVPDAREQQVMRWIVMQRQAGWTWERIYFDLRNAPARAMSGPCRGFVGPVLRKCRERRGSLCVSDRGSVGANRSLPPCCFTSWSVACAFADAVPLLIRTDSSTAPVKPLANSRGPRRWVNRPQAG
jgi:hypothetical protein